MLATLHRQSLPESLPLSPGIRYDIPGFRHRAMLVEVG